MLNSFQNSCKKNNKNVIKQPPKKNLLNLFILNEKTKTMKKKLMEKLFFSLVSNYKGIPPLA